MAQEESKCFLCSTSLSTPPPREDEEKLGRGRRTRRTGTRNIIKSSNLDQQKINEMLFKYFLGGCEDVELKKRLISSSALLALCNSCEGMANKVQDLHEELEALQVKLFEQLTEVKKVIFSSSRWKGDGRKRNSFGKDSELDQLVVEFQTFIWENDKKQMGIPSQFSEKNDNTIKSNRISTTTREIPEKMEVDDEDSDSESDTVDFNPVDFPPDDSEGEEAEEVDNESIHSFSQSESSDVDEFSQDDLLDKVKKLETKDGKTRSAYFCNQCSFRSLKGLDVENHFRKRHDTPEKPFQCSDCSMKFSLEQALFLHTYLRHKFKKGKRRIICDLCKVSVKPGKSWRTHMAKVHPDEKQFDCELCGEVFLNYAKLIVHSRLRHPYTKLRCCLCPNPEETELLNLSDELPRHIDEIHGISDLRLKCEESNCSSSQVFYYQQKQLDLHKNKCHGDETSFHCKKCSLTFPSYSEFRAHNADLHPSTKERYQCKLCPATFGWSGSLFKHNVLEHNHPGLKCHLCGETFYSKGTFENHLNSKHPDRDGAEQFLCAHCPKSFPTEKRRNDHEKTHDDSASAKPFSCDQCNFTGRKKSALVLHVSTLHASSKDFCCDICGFVTTSKYNLAKHVTRHTKPFECLVTDCHKRFGCRKDVKAHSYTHGDERQFGCRICGGRFKTEKNLKKHKIVHKEERPFKCDFCEEDFKIKSSLIRHQKRKHKDGVSVLSKRKRDTSTRTGSNKKVANKKMSSSTSTKMTQPTNSGSGTTFERDARGVTLIQGEVDGIAFEYQMPE